MSLDKLDQQGPWGQSSGSGANGQGPWGQKGSSKSGGNSWGAAKNGGSQSSGGSQAGGGGGFGGGFDANIPNDRLFRYILIGFSVLAILFLLSTMIFQVQPGSVGIVKQFGQYSREAQPGLNFKLPAPIETLSIVDTAAVRSTEIGYEVLGANSRRSIAVEKQMITGDQNIIEIEASVQWRVQNPQSYLFNIRDPEQTVKIASESTIREIIGRTTIHDALSVGRDQIQISVKILLQDVLDSYQSGIEISEVLLQNVQPPQQVKAAFDDVQSAEQDRDTLKNQAERYANEVIPKARGQSEALRNEALTYYERAVNDAKGRAERFITYADAYAKAPELTEKRLKLEVVRDILKSKGNIIIDEDLGSAPLPYLPLPSLANNN